MSAPTSRDAIGRSAVVLLSGGMDSTTSLAWARTQGFACHTLAIDYGQRHNVELAAARRVAASLGVSDHREVRVDLRAIGGSALTDSVAVPKDRADTTIGDGVPVTYVPARNTVFSAWRSVRGDDRRSRSRRRDEHSRLLRYPDCRPEFVRAFEALARVATKAASRARSSDSTLR
jgi:7-cyano-7-deazaguanine synthase